MEEKKRGHITGEGRDPRVVSILITFFLCLALAMTGLIVTKGQGLTGPS